MLMVCCLSAQLSNAQYIKAKKGDIVVFSEAVITNKPTFELESRKLKLQTDMLSARNAEVKSLRSEISELENMNRILKQDTAALSQSLALTRVAYQETSEENRQLTKIVKRQGRWYNKNAVWFFLGIGATVATQAYLLK